VSIPILHGSGFGETFAWISRTRNVQHAGSRKQGKRCGTLSGLRQGLSVEASESRSAGSRHDSEACAFIVQMHSLHCHVRNVQAVRKSRLLGAQRRSEESNGQEEHALLAVVEIQRLATEAPKDQRRDNDYSAAGEADNERLAR